MVSKLILPECGQPKTLGTAVAPHYEREGSLFEAIINGANAGMRLIFGIVALLLAILGLVALLDLLLGTVGTWVNGLFGWPGTWSLKGLLGYLFYPFTLIIGVPPSDAGVISGIIGERAVVTEVAAYQDLGAAIANEQLQHPRSAVLAAYALCGFAHVASLAIFVGGIAAIVPNRTATLTKVGLRALLAATIACLITACVAGTFFTRGSLLFGPQ
jgi:CNT family concentrative nucleoside transporter